MRHGRDAECARVGRLLAEARAGRSGVLVVRGEPGIGKTDLLRHAAAQASGMSVLEVRSVESEAEIPFAGLSELLDPVLDLLGTIPGPQGAALAGALALGPSTTPDRFAIAAATLSILTAAAERRPLLALVDDAHWLDAASAEAILFAARRVNSDPVALVFALRDGVQTAFDPAGLPLVELSGLDERTGRELVTARCDVPVPGEVAGTLVRATAGNPLALIELCDLLSERQLTGREPLSDPLPSSARVERLFLARAAGLPETTRDALLVAAASESPDPGAILRAASALGLGASALEPAEAAGLLAIDSGRLEWRHPLVRSAVYHGASPTKRRTAHRALAGALDGAHEADRRAWHLAAAATAPDETVACALEEAAVRAGARGGVSAAAAAFERAAALTPGEAERARRLLGAANAYALAGRLRHAAELVESALPLAADAAERSDGQQLRGRIALWSGEPLVAHRIFLAEAARVERADPGRAVALLADAARAASLAGEIETELATARRAEAVAARTGREHQAVAAAALGRANVLGGDRDAARELLAAAASALEHADPLALAFANQLVSEGSVWIEEYEQARGVLQRVIDAARAASAIGLLPQALANLSELEFRVGRFPAAYALAAESVAIADALGEAGEATFGLVCTAQVEAVTGREGECRAHAGEAIAQALATGADTGLVYGNYALGFLELGLGRTADAIPRLETVAAFVAEHGPDDPGVLQWAADLVEAYALAGRGRDAETALETLESQAERTESPWALAVTARCRGLLADDDEFEENFERALQRHALTPSPFERARTLLHYGRRLRRGRRRSEARATLRSALETFERLGAEPWAAQARAEHTAAGGRGRRVPTAGLGQLTPQELQIALLVADGATNREAAASLFLSTKTIEFHLAKAYRKLGVRSRTELARLLAREVVAGRDAPPALPRPTARDASRV